MPSVKARIAAKSKAFILAENLSALPYRKGRQIVSCGSSVLFIIATLIAPPRIRQAKNEVNGAIRDGFTRDQKQFSLFFAFQREPRLRGPCRSASALETRVK
jgi:hypothetical protein